VYNVTNINNYMYLEYLFLSKIILLSKIFYIIYLYIINIELDYGATRS
jgi:hypothetical protein